jgi:hypothetical protein
LRGALWRFLLRQSWKLFELGFLVQYRQTAIQYRPCGLITIYACMNYEGASIRSLRSRAQGHAPIASVILLLRELGVSAVIDPVPDSSSIPDIKNALSRQRGSRKCCVFRCTRVLANVQSGFERMQVMLPSRKRYKTPTHGIYNSYGKQIGENLSCGAPSSSLGVFSRSFSVKNVRSPTGFGFPGAGCLECLSSWS